MKYLILILILINWQAYALSEDLFFQDKTVGWFWYKDRNLPTSKNSIQRNIDPAAQVDFEKEELERLLKIAIKQPTRQNLINFIIRLHQVNLMNPELDSLKTYPVNQAAKEIYKQQKTWNINAKIAKLSQTHGLFFIFKSDCAYCHAFAATVKSFANQYNWSLIPITLDGKTIAEFPEARADNGLARTLKVNAVPALLMIEPKANKILPIAIGAISFDEIIERIDLLTRNLQI